MKAIKTVFLVKGQTYAIEGAGQDAASAAIQQFPKDTVKLHGFIVNDEFKKADLTSHWERTQMRKEK